MEEIKQPERKPDKTLPKNDPYGCDSPEDVNIQACSATDCTGLIPSLPQSEAELESYAQLYSYPGEFSDQAT